MTALLEQFNKEQMQKISYTIPTFRPGDTLKVTVKVIDGVSERMQIFEGICIGRENRGFHSSFKIKRSSHGENIEIKLFLYSPLINSIEVLKLGKVRRAKPNYILKRFGKAARIKERTSYKKQKSE